MRDLYFEYSEGFAEQYYTISHAYNNKSKQEDSPKEKENEEEKEKGKEKAEEKEKEEEKKKEEEKEKDDEAKPEKRRIGPRPDAGGDFHVVDDDGELIGLDLRLWDSELMSGHVVPVLYELYADVNEAWRKDRHKFARDVLSDLLTEYRNDDDGEDTRAQMTEGMYLACAHVD